jgi:CBS domain-containing protein
MSNAETFLVLFNKIEQFLDQLNQSTEHYGFRRLVDNLSKRNDLVASFKLELVDYLELRNAIVHKSTGEPIAEPHPDVIKKMQQIYDALSNPPRAIKIAAKPVYSCTTKTPILEIIKEMNRNFYTSIPVYHQDQFVGVFSDNSLTRWLAHINKPLDLKDILVSQAQEYFDKTDNKFNSYRFMDIETDVFTVKQAFTSFTKEKMRLGAIFLTQTGQKNEKIQGIITAWDLPKISKF